MKVLSFIIFSVFLFHIDAKAQEKFTQRNELGLNATGFIANYFNLGGVSSNNFYLIDYKYRLNKNFALRSSIDFTLGTDNVEQQVGRRTYLKNQSVDLRIGAEIRKELSEKWTWFYGIDMVGSQRGNSSESIQQLRNPVSFEFFDAKTFNASTTQNVGGGPVVGLRWEVHPRITLWTEGRLYFTYNESRVESGWKDLPDNIKDFPQFETVSRTSFSTSLDFFPPLDVFVSFKF